MNMILSLLGGSLVYVIYLVYYRLYLSPIAKFPGPKLAAATYLYEFYYDIILGGKYIWKVKELHEKYGPIVRINPGGLHVIDPAFWDVMYTASTNSNRRDKWIWETEGIDVVMQYCFDRSDHHIEAPGFDPAYYNTSFGAARAIALLKHVPLILTIMKSLPEPVAMKMGDEVSANIKLTRERMDQIEDVRRIGFEKADQVHKTVFHTLLQSDLPASEKETRRLAEEAVLLVGAGTHTTSWVLTIITFYLLSNPSLLRKLRDELKTVLPNPKSEAPLMELEKLPFLTAVLKEGLRMGYGATVRSSRIAPDTSLRYGDWIIPARTPVGMTIPLTHHDESIFPNSHSFEPRRWLEPNAAQLEKYLVSFSKGSRNCVGMNLAWAEMYMCTAAVFRRFGSRDVRESEDLGFLELFETDESDVRLVSDMFFPVAKEGSKGIRVKIST
ncbi:hypothetical protein N0V90_004702 [Kalmusia sp. IMI 367209]|nr:hypothetical protein N0V90_004702 [Kalmusia sp. IMI 367209]